MAKHHEDHPDYAEMGIFAGYGEQDKECPFIDPEYTLPLDKKCPVCGATGSIEDAEMCIDAIK